MGIGERRKKRVLKWQATLCDLPSQRKALRDPITEYVEAGVGIEPAYTALQAARSKDFSMSYVLITLDPPLRLPIASFSLPRARIQRDERWSPTEFEPSAGDSSSPLATEGSYC